MMENIDGMIIKYYREKLEYYEQAYEDHETDHSEKCDVEWIGDCMELVYIANIIEETEQKIAEFIRIIEETEGLSKEVGEAWNNSAKPREDNVVISITTAGNETVPHAFRNWNNETELPWHNCQELDGNRVETISHKEIINAMKNGGK